MTHTTRIDICICTFRRTHIVNTLHSLKGLITASHWDVRIIVADNDTLPSAKERVLSAAPDIEFPITYIHAPERNISVARNACLDASTADYLVFLDDDELANPTWLQSLVTTCEAENATAVLGPVIATYSDQYPHWIKSGDFHSTHPVWVNGKIITGYTANLLLRKNAAELKGLRFRVELGTTGGEDTLFLSTMCRRGGNIAYAEDAVIIEPVPVARASLSWLMKRRFRSGQTHARLIMEQNGRSIFTRFKYFMLAFAKATFCFAQVLISIGHINTSISWILRGSLHVGVMARLTGKQDIIQYGN
jgi:succinoglycan biosynthesis protein ExoM